MGTKNLGDGDFESGRHDDVAGARASLLASWEILGADNFWTPTLGGGVFGEMRAWERSSPIAGLVTPREPSEDPLLDGSVVGAGMSATMGVSIARPWRFRFDLYADMRLATWELSGTGHADLAPELVPSVLATLGVEYDLVSRAMLKPKTSARR
jgi:hypothetical protein